MRLDVDLSTLSITCGCLAVCTCRLLLCMWLARLGPTASASSAVGLSCWTALTAKRGRSLA
jgi:hypothetical protein